MYFSETTADLQNLGGDCSQSEQDFLRLSDANINA